MPVPAQRSLKRAVSPGASLRLVVAGRSPCGQRNRVPKYVHDHICFHVENNEVLIYNPILHFLRKPGKVKQDGWRHGVIFPRRRVDIVGSQFPVVFRYADQICEDPFRVLVVRCCQGTRKVRTHFWSKDVAFTRIPAQFSYMACHGALALLDLSDRSRGLEMRKMKRVFSLVMQPHIALYTLIEYVQSMSITPVLLVFT